MKPKYSLIRQRFNAFWLRFNCHSAQSKQPETGQIIIQKDTIPRDLYIQSVKVENENVVINWNKDSNQEDSILPIEFLVNNCPSDIAPSTKETRFKTSQVNIYIFIAILFTLICVKYAIYYWILTKNYLD